MVSASADLMARAMREFDHRLETMFGPIREPPTLSARLGHLKHGPGGSGLAGPCDDDCKKCAVEAKQTQAAVHLATPAVVIDKPCDPLDVMYDGVTLRGLLNVNDCNARNDGPYIQVIPMSPIQRAAVSAHWSAELRAKMAAATERARQRITVDQED